VRGRFTIGRWSSYQLFGVLGFLAGLALVTALALRLGLSWIARLDLVLAPPLALLLGLLFGSMGIGRRQIVFYEKAGQALAATALALFATGQPVARGLDLAMLGIGTFLAFGRIGCFNAACCHGRRARWGVRYGWQHADRTLPRRWVGVVLFPVQLVDAAASAFAVAAGTAMLLGGAAAGAPLAAYVSVYAPCRFLLEWFRGDDRRRVRAGLSEAQWTSTGAELAIALYHPSWWTLACASLLAAASLALGLARRHGAWPHLWLTTAAHLAELDRVVDRLIADGPPLTTSERLRLQLISLPDARFELSISRDGQALSNHASHLLARQLGRRWMVLASEPRLVIATGGQRAVGID
jgi:hypothetical protein